MLIIEGPDGSGKTTLITEIEKRLSVTREPRAVTSSAVAKRELGSFITEEVAKGFGKRVYDRFALVSSPFYCMLPNPTFDGAFRDPAWLEEAWIKFRQVSPLIIVCLPPLEVVIHNVMADDTSKVAQGDIETIYWLYHNFAAQYPWVATVYDYTKNDFEDLEYIFKLLEARLTK